MTIIHDAPASAQRRLQELGIPIEPLQAAIEAGHVARISSSPNDPLFIPGTMAWSHTVRELRNQLVPRGWRKSDPKNFSLVTLDERRIQIVVESGDEFVRNASGSPRTKSLKGLYMEALTVRNNAESDFFPETLDEELRAAISTLQYPTWIFLIHITDDERRAELSYPLTMSDGHLSGWKERIFVPDSASTGGQSIYDANDGALEIDVPVFRKIA